MSDRSAAMLLRFLKRFREVRWIKRVLSTLFEVLFRLDPIVPMSLTVKLMYHGIMGKKLDLESPRDFNEEVQWLKVYYRNPLLVQCADKYRVRDYVAGCGLNHILNEVYAVYEDAEDIDFRQLPQRFVMKTNNGCKTLIICNDKDALNQYEIKKTFKRWLKQRMGYIAGEYHYNCIRPLIIVEKNLSLVDGTLPVDYKVFCFNGQPHYVSVLIDRDEDTLVPKKRAVFDFRWNAQDFVLPHYYADPALFPRPKCLDEMYNIAKRLAAPFPFVRVDLYEIDGKIVFGELTFTPSAGFGRAFTQQCLDHFGGLLTLPPKSSTRSWF